MIASETGGVLDNLHSTVFTLDDALVVRYVNPAGEMLFGLSRRQLTGRSLADILPESPAWIAQLRQVLDSGHPLTVHDLRLVMRDGHFVTTDCTATPIARADGETRLLVELIQIDRLLRMTRDETRSGQFAAARELLRSLAHEVKNPLGGLRGAAQLLERELPNAALTDYTDIIIREADRLRALVDRMLGPVVPPEFAPVNVHRILDHVRGLLMAEFGEGLRVERDYDPSLPPLLGDTDQLVQATLNIARNGAQAVAGNGTIRLRTRAARNVYDGERRHRLMLRVDIEDDGPGIPDALRDRLFLPLISGRAGGTGLGLAIAHEIVRRHGGHIEFSSRPGKTIFRLYLPAENGNE